MKLFAGIDPGLSGAVALLDPVVDKIRIVDMPTHSIKGKRTIDLYELARFFDLYWSEIHLAVIENVHSMPRQGVASSFSFGKSAGIAEMAVAAHFIPMHHVSPGKWKAAFGLTSDKDASRRAASRLFPTFSHLWARAKDDGRAEAVLLAVYGSKLK